MKRVQKNSKERLRRQRGTWVEAVVKKYLLVHDIILSKGWLIMWNLLSIQCYDIEATCEDKFEKVSLTLLMIVIN